MATSRASDARAAVDLTFEELYRGHQAGVYRAALRELGNVHDAEDVTQAAFVDAYRAVLRGTEPESPRAWLLAISENVRRRRFRTAQRRPHEVPTDDADFPLTAELPYEQVRALAQALAALSPEQRRVFVLRELAGLSYDEVAAEVGATVPAVQMLLFRARRSLRAELEPPSVKRKAGFFVPLPGWVTGLMARFDPSVLAPRAAGALGAAAIAVVGVSVAAPDAPADGISSQAIAPRAVAVAVSQRTRATVGPPSLAARLAARVSVRQSPRSVRPSVTARGARPGNPVAPTPSAPSSAPVSPAPFAEAVPQQATVANPVTLAAAVSSLPSVAESIPVSIPALEPPRLPVPLPNEPLRDRPELPVPSPPSTASLDDIAAGAMGVAGADAPPLPVPALPPVALPPVP